MVTPPEIYTGAQFTLRYSECQKRIPDYFNGNVFGFKAAWAKAIDEGFINVGDVPHFASGIDHIVKRLELRDRFKEISAETPDAWIMLCMQRFVEVSDKYEDVLAMEAAEGFDVTNPSKESRIIEYGHIVNGQVQDTPYGELNDSSNYVSGRTRESHSGADTIQERNELDGDILMDFRKKWDTTVNKIVEEFDVLFIRITGAGFVARGE